MTTNAPASVIPSAPAAPDIRGLKPPIYIPDPWFWVWVTLAVLAGLAVMICIWKFWGKKAIATPIIPPIPPHERARAKLDEALALIAQPRPFCIMVSDTVRVYLEERFNFHAPERTTEEFLHELRATDLLVNQQKESLGEFLSVCDMVKFARYEPGKPELEALHQSAVRLIDETEPAPAPVESVSIQVSST
jgi:hypothetical protein